VVHPLNDQKLLFTINEASPSLIIPLNKEPDSHVEKHQTKTLFAKPATHQSRDSLFELSVGEDNKNSTLAAQNLKDGLFRKTSGQNFILKSRLVKIGNQRERKISVKQKGPTFVGQASIQA
jgi:hypothetical protein